MPTNHHNSTSTVVSARSTALALLVATLLPTLLAVTCSVVLSGQRVVVIAYAIGKVLQLGFPVVWVLAVERKTIRFTRPQTNGLIAGGLYGMFVVALTMTVYYGLVSGSESLAEVPEVIRQKLRAYGIAGWRDFYWLGLYYAIPHTLAEEYFWRWFVYGRLKEFLSVRNAIVISGFAFTLHHILLAYRYLGDAWGFIAAFAVGVAISGMVWAWLYEKTNALYAAWLSHLIVDAGLIWMAYEFWRS